MLKKTLHKTVFPLLFQLNVTIDTCNVIFVTVSGIAKPGTLVALMGPR